MKIARCSSGKGAPFWAVVDTAAASVTPIAAPFAEWAPAVTAGDPSVLSRDAGAPIPLAAVRLLPPAERASKVVVVGANYVRHLAEMNIALSEAPVAFLKAYGALIGAHDPIRYPPMTQALDHEVELVAVVGKPLYDPSRAIESVLGYTVGNDVSARDLQKGTPGIGMDLFAAKSLDATTGLGPWIVTRDEFGDHSPDLRLMLRVNGVMHQDGRTSSMRWNIPQLLARVNSLSTLEPGDIMFTGTPEGVGWQAGRYLQLGDVVEAEIEGIGTLRNRVEAAC